MLRQKKLDEAEPLLLKSDTLVADRIALAPRWEKHFPEDVARRLAEHYTALGQPEHAAKWQAEQSKRSTGE